MPRSKCFTTSMLLRRNPHHSSSSSVYSSRICRWLQSWLLPLTRFYIARYSGPLWAKKGAWEHCNIIVSSFPLSYRPSAVTNNTLFVRIPIVLSRKEETTNNNTVYTHDLGAVSKAIWQQWVNDWKQWPTHSSVPHGAQIYFWWFWRAHIFEQRQCQRLHTSRT